MAHHGVANLWDAVPASTRARLAGLVLAGLRGAIVDCNDPYLQEWVLQLNSTPHTNGYNMRVEQHRPRLKPEDIYAPAHKEIWEIEALDRLNRGDQTTVTYIHRPSPHKTAVNAVNADATADLNTLPNGLTPPSTPWVTLNPRPRQPATRCLNRHLPINPFGFHVPNIGNNVNTTVLIGVSPMTLLGRVSPIPHAMTPIGRFGVSLRVVNVRVMVAKKVMVAVRAVVAIRVVVAVRASGAIKGERERPFERSNPQAPL